MELRVPKDLQVLQGYKVSQVQLEHRGQQVPQVFKVLRVPRAVMV